MAQGVFLDYDLINIDPIALHNHLSTELDKLAKAQIIYTRGGREYLTENISLDWLALVDSQSFFRWLDLKRQQKQKYNSQNYQIILRLQWL